MKFSDMLASKSDAELGAMMRDRFARLAEARDMGLTDTHPVEQFNADNKVLRAHRVAKDAGGSGLGAKTLEEANDPPSQDDPPHTPGTPGAPSRMSENELRREYAAADRRMAADHAREDFEIRQRAGANMDGELLAARARRSEPAAVAAMTAAIPNYGRLR
jgi:hypothetical protein